MHNRRLYIQTCAGIAGIIVCSLTGACLWATGVSYFFSFACLLLIVLIAGWLIGIMNVINKQLSSFFNTVRNHDFSQHYPLKEKEPFQSRLYAEMNQIITLFAHNRREQEENRLYYESIIRVLTHELRNSITPIASLSADMLTYADTSSPGQIKEGLEVIHSQAKDLSAFLDSYHRLTHLPDPEQKKVEATPLFQKLNRLLAAEPGHSSVSYQVAGEVSIQADPNLLVLALINLIRNAIQAIDGQPGGEVKVEASLSGSCPVITVTDNGPGILPEHIPHIFIPFFSTKTEGSGIGLSLSHRIMQLHGGELAVESAPGRTTFTLRF